MQLKCGVSFTTSIHTRFPMFSCTYFLPGPPLAHFPMYCCYIGPRYRLSLMIWLLLLHSVVEALYPASYSRRVWKNTGFCDPELLRWYRWQIKYVNMGGEEMRLLMYSLEGCRQLTRRECVVENRNFCHHCVWVVGVVQFVLHINAVIQKSVLQTGGRFDLLNSHRSYT